MGPWQGGGLQRPVTSILSGQVYLTKCIHQWVLGSRLPNPPTQSSTYYLLWPMKILIWRFYGGVDFLKSNQKYLVSDQRGAGPWRGGGLQRPASSPRASPLARARCVWNRLWGFFFFFFTLVTGPSRSLSLKLSDTRVYEPQIQAQVMRHVHSLYRAVDFTVLSYAASERRGDNFT